MVKPPTDARPRILDAAEERFAATGFDGTTIKAIATTAGVNSALIYYYWAGKEALYAALFERLIERFVAGMARAFDTGGDPAAAVRGFAAVQMAALEAQPRLRRLMAREMVDHDARHAQASIRRLAATTFDRLTALIRAGQRSGRFRRDMDPRFAAISLVGQTAHFHFARPAIELLLNGGKPLLPRTIKAFASHVGAFTLAALEPPKGTAVPRKRRAARGLAGALLALLTLGACARGDRQNIEATGSLEFVEIEIAAMTGGRVRRVLVDEGDRVRRGDTLVVLEIPTLAADLAGRRARVGVARATLAELERGPLAPEIARAEADLAGLASEVNRTASDVRRLAPLAARDLASAQQLEAAEGAASLAASRRDAAAAQLQLLRDGTPRERLAAARADVAAAVASVAAAESTARDLILLAPVDGRVLARRAEPGEVIAAGEGAMQLAETGRQWVRVFVGQDALPLLRPGLEVEATLDAYPDRPFTGRILSIATQAEYTPRVALTERERADLLFAVRAEFRDTTEFLKAGLPVTLRLAARR